MKPIFLAATIALAVTVPLMQAQSLAQLRWKKRVLILYAPSGSEKKLARQQELLRAREAAVQERDLVQIVVGQGSDTPEISTRFELKDAGFTLLLLGKDGGEKLRSGRVVQPDTLFRVIGAMPMRQEEARSRSNR